MCRIVEVIGKKFARYLTAGVDAAAFNIIVVRSGHAVGACARYNCVYRPGRHVEYKLATRVLTASVDAGAHETGPPPTTVTVYL